MQEGGRGVAGGGQGDGNTAGVDHSPSAERGTMPQDRAAGRRGKKPGGKRAALPAGDADTTGGQWRPRIYIASCGGLCLPGASPGGMLWRVTGRDAAPPPSLYTFPRAAWGSARRSPRVPFRAAFTEFFPFFPLCHFKVHKGCPRMRPGARPKSRCR